MKVEQSNPTVIEIQTNTLDEKQIRKRFETLGYDEEVYLVLLLDRQPDREEKEVEEEGDDDDDELATTGTGASKRAAPARETINQPLRDFSIGCRPLFAGSRMCAGLHAW